MNMQGGYMKNLGLLAGMILLLCVAASAQQPVAGVKAVGVKLGFDVAKINTAYQELDEFLDTRAGFIGGGFLTYGFNRHFALQPEILYVNKGAQKGLFLFTAYWEIDYLEFPILLKYDLDPGGSVHPYLFAGPALGILLNSKIGALDYTYDVTDAMKPVDFSIAFGGAVDYKRVSLDLRYTVGLANTVDAAKVNKMTEATPDKWWYLEGDPSIKNTNFSFMLGIRIN
jgi:opacity protein-like surface antigen